MALEEAIEEKDNNWEDELCMCCRYSEILFLYMLFCILKFICNTPSREKQAILFTVHIIEPSLLFVCF